MSDANFDPRADEGGDIERDRSKDRPDGYDRLTDRGDVWKIECPGCGDTVGETTRDRCGDCAYSIEKDGGHPPTDPGERKR